METFTISEAADLLDGQVSKAALRKRVQKPKAPAGLRSVLGPDGKRRIPRSELERAGFRLDPTQPDNSELIRELTERIAAQERELVELRALPERIDEQRRQAEEEAAARAQAERERDLERERLQRLAQVGWRERRRLLRDLRAA
jgi:hypothetical protein